MGLTKCVPVAPAFSPHSWPVGNRNTRYPCGTAIAALASLPEGLQHNQSSCSIVSLSLGLMPVKVALLSVITASSGTVTSSTIPVFDRQQSRHRLGDTWPDTAFQRGFFSRKITVFIRQVKDRCRFRGKSPDDLWILSVRATTQTCAKLSAPTDSVFLHIEPSVREVKGLSSF